MGRLATIGVKRYLEGQALWDKKFSNHVKKVARQREKNLALAKEDNIKMMSKLHDRLVRHHRSHPVTADNTSGESAASDNANNGNISLNSPLWNWSWALEGEDPPPSSIVARRDTVRFPRNNFFYVCIGGEGLELSIFI